MKKDAVSKVDYVKLSPGLYVARHSHGITELDLRFVRPNSGTYIPPAAMHTMEHLGSEFIGKHRHWHDKKIYFGPMGCRTGFSLLLYGWHEISGKESQVYKLVHEMTEYIMNFEGEIPGATEEECGNYKEHDLSGAKEWAEKYLNALENLNYIYPRVSSQH